MVAFPPCKINLGLHVTRKRQDGYHDIETCFYPVVWTDILEIIPSDEFTFTSTGLPISGENNLCTKAYELLRKDFSIGPVKIHLHKIIPIGAGLGGGSSDAAATLRLLNTVFQLNLPAEKLSSYAAQLGSDCAFFVQHKPMLGTERGDKLHALNVTLQGKFLALVHPGIHVSTQEAYAHVTPALPVMPIRDILEKLPVDQWKKHLVNDFEASVFKNHAAIRNYKERLYDMGALYASMSGSGSTVFGIFDTEINLIEREFEGCTTWTGVLSI